MARAFLSRALIGSAPTEMAPLQGLRVLFNYLMIAGHVPIFSGIMLDSPATLRDLNPHASLFQKSWYKLTEIGMLLSVDVFFFISGFCMAASIAVAASHDKSADLEEAALHPRLLLRYLISRWLRLAPMYIFVSAISGASGREECVNWREVFFFDNFFQRWRDILPAVDCCNPVGWSMAVDFQSHVLISLLMLVLRSWNALRVALWTITGASVVSRTVTWIAAGAPPYILPGTMYGLRDEEHKQQLAASMGMVPGRFDVNDPVILEKMRTLIAYTPWYYATMHRMGAVFVGAAVWIAMRNNAPVCSRVQNAPGLSITFVVIVWAAFQWLFEKFAAGDPLTWTMIAVEGVEHIATAIATGVVVMLTCSVTEEQGTAARASSPIAKALRGFLGHPVFLWLSRYSYALYMTHSVWASSIYGTWPRLTKENYSYTSVNLAGVKLYLMSLSMAIPFCIAEEAALWIRKQVIRVAFPPAVDAVAEGAETTIGDAQVKKDL